MAFKRDYPTWRRKLGDGEAHSKWASETLQGGQGGVSSTSLDPTDLGLLDTGDLRELLLRQTALLTSGRQPSTQVFSSVDLVGIGSRCGLIDRINMRRPRLFRALGKLADDLPAIASTAYGPVQSPPGGRACSHARSWVMNGKSGTHTVSDLDFFPSRRGRCRCRMAPGRSQWQQLRRPVRSSPMC